MKTRIILLITLLAVGLGVKASDYIQSISVLSSDYINDIEDMPEYRPINGGTVIIPQFDESCPECIKAPFAYACKLLEEYIPPCLPLRVKVGCETLQDSYPNAVSRISTKMISDFESSSYKFVPMSMLKGAIVSGLLDQPSVAFLNSVPNVEYLTGMPDIEITYNQNMLDEISFSLHAEPGDKYDFVSVALRDMLRGLSFSSNFRYSSKDGLVDPSPAMTPFELIINRSLGSDSATRLSNATSGELLLNGTDYKLYAPETWQNGVSLNYFIPRAINL